MTAQMTRPVDTGDTTGDLLTGIKVHDVDTHVQEPFDLWTSRVDPKWGDMIPHAIVDGEGREFWYVGDEMYCGPSNGFTVVPEPDEVTLAGTNEPTARLQWMDRHGVYSQVLYPNHLGFFVAAFLKMDPALRSACVRAYNDFLAEFASADPKRLLPMANLPWWDLDEAIAELERCQAMGHKGVNLGWEFQKVGFPPLRDDHWEPLLKRIEEMGLPVNFHIGFNSTEVDIKQLAVQTELDKVGFAAMFFASNQRCITELILGRICHRYPALKFVSVESGVGFVPYLVESLDWQFQNRALHKLYPDMLLPSEYFRRQIYATFWFETDVPRIVDLYPDNFMFESDYPHSASLTPNGSQEYVQGPRDVIAANLSELPRELLVKVLQDNAAAVYGLD